MIKVCKFIPDLKVYIDEAVGNGGLHEIFTKDGSVRFFLMDGEEMPDEYKKLLVQNKELNLLQVPANQREKMSNRIQDIENYLNGKKPNP